MDEEDEECPTCEGSGEVTGNYFAEDGMETCPDCGGRGIKNDVGENNG